MKLDFSFLRSGDRAAVSELVANASATKRLADLGFIPGAVVEMIRPGNPCIVRVEDGTCVGLGSGHQATIRLQRELVQ